MKKSSYIKQIEKICADRPDIVDAFKDVDRRIFIPPNYRKYAEFDMPLPIGFGQTTSQPSLIADMFCLADVQPTDKILEIGTGTGFSTSVLASLGAEVYTVEKVPQLYERAVRNLMEYSNVHVFLAEDVIGLPSLAPFDKILVYAYADMVPVELINQLKIGGVMIIPLGDEIMQYLTKIIKTEKGDIMERLYQVRFVPLK